MSYDLMVFDKSSAPKMADEFMKWYQKQTEWEEEHGYDSPEVSSPALQECFGMIRELYPPMNRAYAPEEKRLEAEPGLEERLCDYCFGRDVIYMSFGYQVAEQAYDHVKRAAGFSGAGFFEAGGKGKPCWFEAGQMTLEGEWFRPTEVSDFSEVSTKLEKMTVKNRSFLILTDGVGNYIQAGGCKDRFTVEMRWYSDITDYTHRKASVKSEGTGGTVSAEKEMDSVLICGRSVSVDISQVLNLQMVLQLFRDFYFHRDGETFDGRSVSSVDHGNGDGREAGTEERTFFWTDMEL